MSRNIFVFSSEAGSRLASVFVDAVCSEFPHVTIIASDIPRNATPTDWEAIKANQPAIVCIVWDSDLRSHVRNFANGLRTVNPALPIVLLQGPTTPDTDVLQAKITQVHVLAFPWRDGSLMQLLGPHLQSETIAREPDSKQAFNY